MFAACTAHNKCGAVHNFDSTRELLLLLLRPDVHSAMHCTVVRRQSAFIAPVTWGDAGDKATLILHNS